MTGRIAFGPMGEAPMSSMPLTDQVRMGKAFLTRFSNISEEEWRSLPRELAEEVGDLLMKCGALVAASLKDRGS